MKPFIILHAYDNMKRDFKLLEVNNMRYFWTLLWTFLLVQMLTYVSSAMLGVGFDFVAATILSIFATILILILPVLLPNEPADDHGHH